MKPAIQPDSLASRRTGIRRVAWTLAAVALASYASFLFTMMGGK